MTHTTLNEIECTTNRMFKVWLSVNFCVYAPNRQPRFSSESHKYKGILQVLLHD